MCMSECIYEQVCLREGMRSESRLCVCDSGECVSRLVSGLSVHQTSFL